VRAALLGTGDYIREHLVRLHELTFVRFSEQKTKHYRGRRSRERDSVPHSCGFGTAQSLAAACAESTKWSVDLVEVFGTGDGTGAVLHDALEQLTRLYR